jgi:hypothetical protein
MVEPVKTRTVHGQSAGHHPDTRTPRTRVYNTPSTVRTASARPSGEPAPPASKSSSASGQRSAPGHSHRVVVNPLSSCVACGLEFAPLKPKRGPTSKRCDDCYPPAERGRNLQEVRDSVRRRRGEHVPNEVTCANCGVIFDRLKARKFCSSDCRVEKRESDRRAVLLAKYLAR